MPTTCRNSKGFSLFELMVAMGLAAVVMVLVYSVYRAQAASYRTQEGVVDMMQNARAAMFYLERAVRMSGFDPRRTAGAGFVSNFASPYSTAGAATNGFSIAFTVDDDEDGVIDPASSEIVAFRLNGLNQLQRLMIDPATQAASWQTLAENIDALNFVYLDGAVPPNVLTPPLSAAQLAAIRSVQITLVARTEANPMPFGKPKTDRTIYRNQQGTVILNPAGDRFTRTLLSAQILCRNLGL